MPEPETRTTSRADMRATLEQSHSCQASGLQRAEWGIVPPTDGRRSVPLPAEPAEPATRHRAVAALLLAVLSLVGLLSLNYLQRGDQRGGVAALLGLPDGLKVALALTAIARARRSRTARPRGSVTATVIAEGRGSTRVGTVARNGLFAGQQLNAYGRCLNEASTSANRQACQNQFIHAVNHEIAAFRTSGSG